MTLSSTLFAVLLLLLGASLSINVYLVLKLREVYLQRQFIALDPFNKSSFPEHFRKSFDANTSSTRVVIFGDSRAGEWKTPPDDDEFQFQTRGIGGNTSTQVVGRFDLHVEPLNPDVIVLQLGVNDLKTIPFVPESKEHIISWCRNNISSVVEKSRTHGYHVILTTLFPLGDVPLYRRRFGSTEVQQCITEVNRFLRDTYSSQITILDTEKLLADKNGVVRRAYAMDLVHINERGYALINGALMELLSTYRRSL